MKEFLAKRKAHLIFGTTFLLVLALNIIALTAGETILGAIWKALSAVRPMEYIMFAIFWYACAVRPPKDDWYSPLIALNLSRTNTEK